MLRFKAGDVNLYRWEGNNPANTLDPLGLFWQDKKDPPLPEPDLGLPGMGDVFTPGKPGIVTVTVGTGVVQISLGSYKTDPIPASAIPYVARYEITNVKIHAAPLGILPLTPLAPLADLRRDAGVQLDLIARQVNPLLAGRTIVLTEKYNPIEKCINPKNIDVKIKKQDVTVIVPIPDLEAVFGWANGKMSVPRFITFAAVTYTIEGVIKLHLCGECFLPILPGR